MLALGCSDPELVVVSPADGTVITTNDPIVFVLRGVDIPAGTGELEVFVDNRFDDTFTGPVPSTECDGCTFMQTWPRPSVMNGVHEIEFGLIYDLSTIASASVTLTFQRP